MIDFLGWTLVHAAWQGGIIAAVVALAMLCTPRPSARYAIALAGLALMLAAPVVTTIATRSATRHAAPSIVGTIQTAGATIRAFPRTIRAVAVSAVKPSASIESESPLIDRALPLMVVAWLMGVIVLSARIVIGFARIRTLRARGIIPVDAELRARVATLARRLGINRVIDLVASARVDVPMVVGWLRPMILVPISLAAGTSPLQVEMLLAHELAHIRRYDTLINLAQTVVETLLFFHPAAWWISARVRDERESCCDEIAIAACGVTPLEYGTLLLRLEESRESVALAVAANSGSLLRRIRRIAGPAESGTELGSSWIAGIATMLVAIAVVMPPRSAAVAAQLEAGAPPPPSFLKSRASIPGVPRPSARRITQPAIQSAPSISGRWVAVADYSTDTPAVALGGTMTVEQTDRSISIVTDSGGRSVKLTFRIDSAKGNAIEATGPVAFDYGASGYSIHFDSTFGQPGTMRFAELTFTLDASKMLVVQALVPADAGQFPKSTFQRFRRADAVVPGLVQDDSTRQLALEMAVAISKGFGRNAGKDFDYSVQKESPYTGIVLIDGQRATLDQMHALDRRDVRRYSWLVGAVAPQYFADPDASTGVIAFETGQMRKP